MKVVYTSLLASFHLLVFHQSVSLLAFAVPQLVGLLGDRLDICAVRPYFLVV